MAAPQLDVTPDVARELYDAAVSHKSLSVRRRRPTQPASARPTITDYRLPPVTALREPTRSRPCSRCTPPSTRRSPGTHDRDDGGGGVAEGGTKPTSTIAYTAQTGTVTKIAHVSEVTDETLPGLPCLLVSLTADMSAGLYKAENRSC